MTGQPPVYHQDPNARLQQQYQQGHPQVQYNQSPPPQQHAYAAPQQAYAAQGDQQSEFQLVNSGLVLCTGLPPRSRT
ncbi:uncharacterized protein BDZ99DRAFT_459328 [Mytilinidion resinicola]|uniref:Uncharacterized protein n=1 Tax=Mytilinidion resinicola TaxID=574789 RepID=A0A6A6Z415_9PEZI|nr:uncharacterized protein BDZ99DRAFT_459328 [Mytilinidion resinicola]KAF2815479.1 hypothetical protein BDZ99DRAFT_459328 [Mytilinidion resinicola]